MFNLVTPRMGQCTQTNVTIGPTPTLIVDMNLNRKTLAIQNQSDSVNVFIGPTADVEASGANCGYMLIPGDSFVDNATSVEWWAITSADAAPVNVSEVS